MSSKQNVFEINLDLPDEQLLELSNKIGVGLSLDEMKSVKNYFKEKGRNPTDIEIQAIGQAWSEHCCYKSSKNLLKKFIFNIEAPQNIFVIKEDAGVVEFDKDYAYVLALESHNHPSAVEPYGGAATGVGGILRDVVCMGAQPVALIDPIFFGPLDLPYDQLPKGLKHPEFLFRGVVAGIRDYGNRVGIPTVSGSVYFHPGYTGNCLVNVGCVGIIKKEDIIHSRVKELGDIFVMVGGRTGKDGIHGVNFASAELDETSETSSRSAVQAGDPLTKEPLIHACLEANAKKLLNGMKDLGGGGLSCVVGEMAHAGGFGAKIKLEKVLLKEKGMKPWEIWISESQERMMLAVSKENLSKVLEIFDMWDVEAVVIGEAIAEKRVLVYYQGEKIFDMDSEFLTGGPLYARDVKIVKRDQKDIQTQAPKDTNDILIKMLSDPNIASKDWVILQYDHTVRGSTSLTPLYGDVVNFSPQDSSIVKPVEELSKGLVISTAVNPFLLEYDPYWGAASAIDEIYRNIVAVGGRPHSLADCLNFGNPEKPESFGDFYQAVTGLNFATKDLQISFSSGNVSLYNESMTGSCPPTPTIVGIGIIDDVDKKITSNFKKEGNSIYLIGNTNREFGGSLYYRLLGINGGISPKMNPENLMNYSKTLLSCMESGIIVSCHDLSEGGLAVAIAEMSFGSDFGASIDLPVLKNMRADEFIFSESNTRWVVEVKNDDRFESILRNANVPFLKLGKVKGNRIEMKQNGVKIIDASVEKLREKWKNVIWEHLG
ncbi:MAG: phosphoribosylformylglycinamidine synthase II [Candidatus Methanofastidiosum methylothiophilum]|jgi:phosphoribosylformylglycinamidine synthase|uniref:Phosphoribosylformylglycinamidine synthase subunit PurL n=1 Tax=Candidatus Methanofastidiosum methylothiophilum TaxID=1705564 RepID=A0A150JCW0_9EURY|nr:MAG: phosphoribosylformylglycinamidine synthase II [Candidatus Methanofastidiosum methylthiophilus]MBP6932914.1 phosphoribosylformylglycinamidine synthase subunit PurL [Methanofastidiosum sp.]OQC52236.1 MAG: phosphoribosylformylglycinamidine synthase II [Euryarchaeota archaeon ADurb.Bin023]KYC56995.1 MAG: phosphoribosylformylglycinamidine synthase II [Candidatus Methanofastidiosum methylthiophilus]KYC57982.1 MAG: phosphoribosylformylglycinamidine synthase II [Candidatus Methanofastidiosum me